VRERPSPRGELKCPSEPACATRRPTGPNRLACRLIPVCPPPPVNVSTLIMMHDAEMILVSTCIDSEPVDARATRHPSYTHSSTSSTGPVNSFPLRSHAPPLHVVLSIVFSRSHQSLEPSSLPCPPCHLMWPSTATCSRDLEILTPCTDRCPCAPALSPHPMQHACSLAAPVHYRALPISSGEQLVLPHDIF
jgi:hypothetical protein